MSAPFLTYHQGGTHEIADALGTVLPRDVVVNRPPLDDANDSIQVIAFRVDEKIKAVRPDAWRGVQAREQTIKRALYEVLGDKSEVERIFLIIVQQKSEY